MPNPYLAYKFGQRFPLLAALIVLIVAPIIAGALIFHAKGGGIEDWIATLFVVVFVALCFIVALRNVRAIRRKQADESSGSK
jgi:positive regulator of sigma E activity